MYFFKNYKIRSKLLINNGFFLIIFIVFLYIFQSAITNLDNVYHHVLDENKEVSERVLAVKILLEESRKNEKNFLLRKKTIYSDLVFRSINLIQEHVSSVRQHAKINKQKEIVKISEAISGSIGSYQETFRKLVEANVNRGLTSELGLSGKLRQTAHELFEVHIMEHDVGGILLSLNKLHHLELKYIHDDSKENSENFFHAIESLKGEIGGHEMRPSYATILKINITNYKKAAKLYGSEQDLAKKIAHKVEMGKQLENLEDVLNSMYVPGIRGLVLQICLLNPFIFSCHRPLISFHTTRSEH